MKKKKRFLLGLVLVVLLFAALVCFQSNRILRSPKVQEFLVQKIQTTVDGTLRYQGSEVKFFPQPALILLRPQLVLSNPSLTVEAENLQFDFEILPMAFGRAEYSALCVAKGKVNTRLPWPSFLGELALRDFVLKVGAIRPNLAIPVKFESDIGDKKRAVVLKGHFMAPSTEKIDWNKITGHFLAELKDIPLADSTKTSTGSDPFFFFKEGVLNASLEAKKKKDDPFLEVSANGKIAGISYEVKQEKTWATPPSFDSEWSFSGAWNAATEDLKIQKMVMGLPFGDLEMNGGLNFGTSEISKLHFSATNMVLEDFLKYWPRFEDVLPFHIGFSGPCKWVLSLEGTLDHLSLHLNLDLDRTLLSYGTYFAKTKDVPLSATFDYLIQKGATLSGDFSIRFQEMSLKGNLTDLDLTNGTGQLNLLTNKFSIKGWEQYIPAFQGYKLEGDAKILANWKGDLRRLEKAEQIFHITIEKGTWTDMKGTGIRNANFSLDYSPLMLEGRGMQLEFGGFPLTADIKVSSTDDNKMETQARILSGELDPVGFWDGVTALLRRKNESAEKDIYDRTGEDIRVLFPTGQRLKDFLIEVHSLGQVWEFAKFQAVAYDGIIDAKGSVDFSAQPVHYQCEGEVKGLSLGSFLDRTGNDQKILEGSLALKLNLEGAGWGKAAWRESLKGRGKFTVLNGKSPTFDVVKPLLLLRPFVGLKEKTESMSAFDQMDFNWALAGGKVSIADFMIKSPDHVVDGEGTVDLDGLVNFRWDVFLPTSLAAEIFPDMALAFRSKPKAHLGPIAVLVSGLISEPELKPDPVQTAEFVNKVEQKKTQNLLYELVFD